MWSCFHRDSRRSLRDRAPGNHADGRRTLGGFAILRREFVSSRHRATRVTATARTGVAEGGAAVLSTACCRFAGLVVAAALSVSCSRSSPAFCRRVTLTVNGQSAIAVGADGGQLSASITPEPGTPPGVCGPWTASASTEITLSGTGAGPRDCENLRTGVNRVWSRVVTSTSFTVAASNLAPHCDANEQPGSG